MRSLLDTHFLLWIVAGADRLARYPWIERYQPWGVSPVSFLEVAYLTEVGRIEADDAFGDVVLDDPRFEVDDISLVPLMRNAVPLSWTRDPFDRLLAAHSSARRVPLCSVDETIVRNHRNVPAEARRT